MNPLIITAAITGAETTKQMNPNLPVTPREQAQAAAECVKAGASIIHLHVRDEKGVPTQSLNRFRESIEAIRAACPKETIIQISTGGAVGEAMEKRIAPIIELKPEMASLNIASMNFGDDVFINHPVDVKKLAKHMQDLKVVPEIEVYDAGHIGIAKRLLKEGLLKRPIHYQFVLGVPGGLSGEPRNLQFMMDSIDSEDTWGVAGIGRFELSCSFIAVVTGGHVRVGFEDNVYYQKGELAKSNAQLVARVARVAEEAGRPVASAVQAREMLGIK
jgi:3-keto-5-aminohexanoate cleavage enzyme